MGKLVRLISRLGFVFLLLFSLSLNGLLLVSTSLFEAASSFAEMIVGSNTVRYRKADEIRRASAEMEKQNRLNRELNSKVAELSSDLNAANSLNKRTHQSVKKVSDRVAVRTTKAAARETAAMAGEAIPFWGIAVIVTATTLEINDFCQTLLDMNELEAIFDPSLALKEEDLSVCGTIVPSKEELWKSASAAPGQAWAATRNAMPTLEDVANFEFPSIDWRSTTDEIKERTETTISKWKKWLTDESE